MENDVINIEKAKEILDGGVEKANEILKNNEQINKLMEEVQAKVDKIPLLRDAIKDLPVMASMVKSYVTKEYTNVSPKVIATIVSAFIYLVKKKDSKDLYAKLCSFYFTPIEERKAMGLNGRRKMEKEFDRKIVIKAYLERLGSIFQNN